jgi:hypothetical protein
MPYYPNTVTWYNDVTDSNANTTVVTTIVDDRWTNLFTTVTILTLTSMALVYLTFRPASAASRNALIFGIWTLTIFLAATLVYTYDPPYHSPYPKARFQLQGNFSAASGTECEMYYTDGNYSKCYTIMPALNITNNRVCCLDVDNIYYRLSISGVGILIIISIILYPVWLMLCFMPSRNRDAEHSYLINNY